MENNPQTPSLESSTLNLEKDLEDATVESLESFVITEEEDKQDSQIDSDTEKTNAIQDVMTQSKYAQVLISICLCFLMKKFQFLFYRFSFEFHHIFLFFSYYKHDSCHLPRH